MLPVHPGEILKEEYMAPLNLSVSELALKLRLSASEIQDIISERRGISVAIAMRLAKFFETDLNLWVNLQAQYEADTISENTRMELEAIVPYSRLHAAQA